ncbi:MAG TPA: glycoside hydrolase family 76 protein [Solirubrobacteraceae bacterium]|nr:glycoside hydrolase family 76 protein [Solirubrobacteraceae bacterium]
MTLVALWLVALALVPASAAAAKSAKVAVARPPSFALAASRGMQEMLGSAGRSPVSWNPTTGLWGAENPSYWWQSALAITTMVRYAERVRSTAPLYQRVLLQTYKRGVYGSRWQFANPYMDDTAWWALAWLAASQYELYYMHDRRDAGRFLSTAEWEARYIAAHPKFCGGIEWSVGTPPDVVINAQFVALTAQLSRYRAAGPFYNRSLASTWLNDAQADLTWLESSGLVNLSRGSVTDSLNASCHPVGGTLTYTEGEVAEALTQMGATLNSGSYYAQAERFLNYTISPVSGLTANGILQEHCEATLGACSRVQYPLDLPAYKGLFVNAVADWSAVTRSPIFNGFLRAQARAVINNAIRGPSPCASPRTCQFSFHWTGEADPSPLGVTLGGQVSALDALTAVLP